MRSIEIWFEFASTYSYPAAARIELVARDAGVEIRWSRLHPTGGAHPQVARRQDLPPHAAVDTGGARQHQ